MLQLLCDSLVYDSLYILQVCSLHLSRLKSQHQFVALIHSFKSVLWYRIRCGQFGIIFTEDQSNNGFQFCHSQVPSRTYTHTSSKYLKRVPVNAMAVGFQKTVRIKFFWIIPVFRAVLNSKGGNYYLLASLYISGN